MTSHLGAPSAASPAFELLFDPQTCGGLLLAVASADADAAVEALRAGGDVGASRIGEIVAARSDGVALEVYAGDAA